MRKQIFTIFAFILFAGMSLAQPAKQVRESTQLWGAYFLQARLTDQLGLWTDVHLRTKEDLLSDLSQGIVRVGLMYYLNDHAKLTAGYAFVNHFPAEGHANISQPEHRPWQQIQWHTNTSKLRLTQWLRLEERFRRKIRDDDNLAEGYSYGTRLRYNFLAAWPLTRKGTAPGGLSLILNDEIHMNLGRKVVYNHFDQNRFFVGLGFQTGKHTSLQAGYMNVFQQLAAGNVYRNLHTARVFLFQNLDFRKVK